MSDAENIDKPDAAPDAATTEGATDSAPPQRVALDKYEAALARQRALEAELAKIKAADEARATKEAEEQGRWQDVARQHETKAQEAARKAERLERMLQLTDHGVTDPDLREFALYRYEQSGSDKEFGAFVKAEMKDGGALAKLLQPATTDDESESEATPKPAGTRTGGVSRPEIPAECIAEAEKHGMDPEYWYNRVWKPREARTKRAS